MKIVLDEFEKKLDNISGYIDSLIEEKNIRNLIVHSGSEICATNEMCRVKNFHIEKAVKIDTKIINFNAIIISLYGAFELFIENILISFLKTMNNKVLEYDKLPEVIRNNNIRLSSELILEKHKSKYSDINEEELIINLNNCFTSNSEYKLNYKAFTKHETNLRPQAINDMFIRVDVTNICKLIISSNRFKEYYAKEKEIEFNNVSSFTSRKKIEEIYSILINLIEYRNKISHGWVDETEDLENVKEKYIEFIRVIGECVYDVLESRVLQYDILPENEIDNIIKVINRKNENILCFNNDNKEIKKGNSILVQTTNNELFETKILNIQVDGNDFDVIEGCNAINIGVMVDKKIKDTYKFYLL